MKTVSLADETPSIEELIKLAREGPVLLLSADGQEFLLSEADDFEQEVEALRRSPAFQRFLDTRSADRRRVPLDEIEREIDQELAAQN